MEQTMNDDTIVAVATAPGTGGIAVVRLSGSDAAFVFSKCWRGRSPGNMSSHRAYLGKIMEEDGEVIDEVLATLFRGPNSFTGEDVVEISCHGSVWIQREIVNRLVRCGARPADPGEFTRRAFINGCIDLSQAEGVADLIAASSRASHRLAISQTCGGFTMHLDGLREQLLEFASLLELELDFSEEEVEFADRSRLRTLADDIMELMERLAGSYASGKALKEGVPVVIAGAPNAGKSTLLNQFLDEDKAIVSDIPGTTRDIIEDIREINGILFRFADTAGLRNASDKVERIGIRKAEERLAKAMIILWVLDLSDSPEKAIGEIIERKTRISEASHILVCNKNDLVGADAHFSCVAGEVCNSFDAVFDISAASGKGIDGIKEKMTELVCGDYNLDTDIILSNSRHYSELLRAIDALRRARVSLDTGLSADFIAQDVRETLHHLGNLTGKITTPDILESIFSRFCIGK